MDIFTALYWLSLNCYHEARGEPQLGQVYVARVVLNRARKTGKSIKEVVNESGQFSWTSSETGQWPISETQALMSCVDSTVAAAHFEINPNITHYHEVSAYPYWASVSEPVTVIGHHKFYEEREKDNEQASIQSIVE